MAPTAADGSHRPRVRDATTADLPAVAAIYTHYVLKTTVTFNTSVRTPAQWQQRFRERIVAGPHLLLVAEVDSRVLGYAETSPFRPHDAYAASYETTIYTAPFAGGRGIGTILYDALFARLADRGAHRAFAVIALPNDASVAFHERFGFVRRGVLTEAGRKFGHWLDIAVFERAI